MDLQIRRIEFLKERIEALTAQKAKLLALSSACAINGQSGREAWAERLDSTISKLGKHSTELAYLQREGN